METTGNGEKKSRIRSPNFPALTLQKSLDLARILFDTHSRHAVPLEVIAKDWGVSAKSSYIAQHIAALSAYGLIDVEGTKEDRKLKVSDLAFNIFIDKRPDSRDRASLIREAALKPDIFQKICAEYVEGLPVDHLLEYQLVKEYEFNPKTVSEFISILRSTMDYAKVYECGNIEADIKPKEEQKTMPASKISTKGTETIHGAAYIPTPDEREIANYPVGQGLKARIVISGNAPITMKSIEKLIKLLELNKEDLPDSITQGADDPTDN